MGSEAWEADESQGGPLRRAASLHLQALEGLDLPEKTWETETVLFIFTSSVERSAQGVLALDKD